MLALLQTAAEKSAAYGISVANALAAVSAFFAALAAVGACWAAKATKDATRSQLLNDLGETFWGEQFHEDCQRLSHFFREESGPGESGWKEAVRRFKSWHEEAGWRDEEEEELGDYRTINAARRRVKGYYHRIWEMEQEGVLKKKDIREKVPSRENVPILLNEVEQLECAVAIPYEPDKQGQLYEFFACKDVFDLPRPVLKQGCPSFSDGSSQRTSTSH